MSKSLPVLAASLLLAALVLASGAGAAAAVAPDGRRPACAHDAVGGLIERTDAAGRKVKFAYDAWGRVVKEVSPTRTLTCEYDRLGRLIAVMDSFTGKTVRYAYNRLGAREKTTLDGVDVTYNSNTVRVALSYKF